MKMGESQKKPGASPGKKPKGRRGGDQKKHAPAGYLTQAQAREILDIPKSTFSYYTRKGYITRHIPEGRQAFPHSNGFYREEEIWNLKESIATQVLKKEDLKTFAEQDEVVKQHQTSVRIARPEDAEGIVEVLTVLDWDAASADQRRSWYKQNDRIDFVVMTEKDGQEIVGGYIHAVPFRQDILEDMMSGRKRGWHILPEYILKYDKPGTYDLYVGIATRHDVPGHIQSFCFRLIAGFIFFMHELLEEGVYVRRLYAVSAEENGQELCTMLGFEPQSAEPGDRFPRYMLDLETSNAHFAVMYRAGIKALREGVSEEA